MYYGVHAPFSSSLWHVSCDVREISEASQDGFDLEEERKSVFVDDDPDPSSLVPHSSSQGDVSRASSSLRDPRFFVVGADAVVQAQLSRGSVPRDRQKVGEAVLLVHASRVDDVPSSSLVNIKSVAGEPYSQFTTEDP